jgi:hypothetical protein
MRATGFAGVILEPITGAAMKKQLTLLAAALAMVGFMAQTADAASRKKAKHYKKAGYYEVVPYPGRMDPRVATAGLLTGAAATAAFFAMNDWHWKWNKTSTDVAWVGRGGAYALTSVGCMAVSPMVATVFVNRPLKPREAHVLVANCALPILGGLIVDAMWEANPQWEAAYR